MPPANRNIGDMASQSAEFLAANVAKYRADKGWTQTDLAEECGWPQPRISEIESGIYDHKTSTIDKLAQALGISSSKLLSKPRANDGNRR